MIKRILTFLLFAPMIALYGQYGGTGVFSVLKQPVNGRQAGWGGYNLAYRTGDANLLLTNPALLGAECNQRISLNINTQLKGVVSGNAAYCQKVKNIGYFGLAVNYIDYGSFDAYDAGGNPEGKTHASETVLALAYAKPINKQLTAGAGLKFVYSVLGPYIAIGISADAGISWRKKDSSLMLGFTLKNAGFMADKYSNTSTELLPFQADIAVCFKPLHMPFRFNITYHDLQKFNLTYNQYLKSNTIDLSGQPTVSKEAGFGDKFVRHFVVGTELVLGKNFGIMVGYNHQRRTEMGPEIRKGVAGFSWGLNFRIAKINITYASACYFPGFNVNLFTFTTGLPEFKKK